MSFRLLTCLGVLTIAALFVDGATPEAGSVTQPREHISIGTEMSRPIGTELPKLWVKVDANCKSISLREYLSQLAEQSDTVIYLDERKVANTQVALSEPVTITLDAKISLNAALTVALEPYGLEHYVKDERIVVTNESFIVSAVEASKGLVR
jgi:hypothetical protein